MPAQVPACLLRCRKLALRVKALEIRNVDLGAGIAPRDDGLRS